MFIDLHRNAANVKEKKDDVVLLDGKRCAKMFFVVGTGIGTGRENMTLPRIGSKTICWPNP